MLAKRIARWLTPVRGLTRVDLTFFMTRLIRGVDQQDNPDTMWLWDALPPAPSSGSIKISVPFAENHRVLGRSRKRAPLLARPSINPGKMKEQHEPHWFRQSA